MSFFDWNNNEVSPTDLHHFYFFHFNGNSSCELTYRNQENRKSHNCKRRAIDSDGDLIMMNELDDISYKNRRNLLRTIFLENAQEVLRIKMDPNTFLPMVNAQLENILLELPPIERSVLELSLEQGFDRKDIARIKNLPDAEVNRLLQEAKNRIFRIINTHIFNW